MALDQALEGDPGLLHAHYTRGLIFHAQGKEHGASLAAFEAVVAADDDDPLVHYYLGRTLAKLERADEAIAEFERAIELDPNSVSAHYALAHQFRLQQRTEEWRPDPGKIRPAQPRRTRGGQLFLPGARRGAS